MNITDFKEFEYAIDKIKDDFERREIDIGFMKNEELFEKYLNFYNQLKKDIKLSADDVDKYSWYIVKFLLTEMSYSDHIKINGRHQKYYMGEVVDGMYEVWFENDLIYFNSIFTIYEYDKKNYMSTFYIVGHDWEEGASYEHKKGADVVCLGPYI